MPSNIIARIVPRKGCSLRPRNRFALTAEESSLAKAYFSRGGPKNRCCVMLESVARRSVEVQVLSLIGILERYRSLGLLRCRSAASVTISIALLSPEKDAAFRLRPRLLSRIACLGFALEGISFSMRHAELYRAQIGSTQA